MTASTILPIAYLLAALLAFAFHQQRAAMLLLFAGFYAAGLLSGEERLLEAALRYAPPLILLAVLLPRVYPWARLHRWLYGFAAVLVALALGAPAHVHVALLRIFGWLAAGLGAPRGAALLLLGAATVCFARWTWRGGPLDLGHFLVCTALAVAAAPLPPVKSAWALAIGWVVAVLAVLVASYRMAFVDPLSGLPNRRALDERLARLSGDYALAMVDIDHFKGFNDTHGHDAGDAVLAAVGWLLRRYAGGHAYRYGGEEFCVVYTGRNADSAATACERVRTALESTDIRLPPLSAAARARGRSRPQSVRVTASFGVARRSSQYRLVADVLKAADQALYRAKGKGRNRVVER